MNYCKQCGETAPEGKNLCWMCAHGGAMKRVQDINDGGINAVRKSNIDDYEDPNEKSIKDAGRKHNEVAGNQTSRDETELPEVNAGLPEDETDGECECCKIRYETEETDDKN